jgi:hypothetical protein
MAERYILVGWFNPWNDYHGFQQVHKDYEGDDGTFPLFVRESDFLKTALNELPAQPVSDVGDARQPGDK